MHIPHWPALIGLALLPALAPAAPASGRVLGAACAACHGTDGQPQPADDALPLAGMNAQVFELRMLAFRSGQAPATVMHQIAKGYTEAQIQAMAVFFAAQPKWTGRAR